MSWYKTAQNVQKDVEEMMKGVTGPDMESLTRDRFQKQIEREMKGITGPNMAALTSSKSELMIEMLKRKFPQVYDKLSAMVEIIQKDKPKGGPQDRVHNV